MRKSSLLIVLLLVPSIMFAMGSKPKTQQSTSTPVDQDIVVNTPLEAIYYLSKGLPKKEKDQIDSKLLIEYLKQGNYPRAVSLLQEIEQANNLSLYINTINLMVKNLPKENKQQRLEEIIGSVQNRDKKDLIIEHIVLASIKDNDVSRVDAFLSELKSRFIKARIHKYLIEYFIKNDDIIKALTYAEEVQNHSEKDQVDALFVLYYASVNNIDEAQRYLNTIPDGQLRESTLSNLGKLFAEDKNFNLSIQYTNEIQRQLLRDETLSILVKAYVEDQKFKSAFQMSDSIKDTYYQALARSFLANALVENGQLKPAIQLASSIEDETLRSDIFYRLSLYHAANNDIEEAFTTLELITDYEKKKAAVKKLATYVGAMKEYHYSLLILKKLEPDALKDIALQDFALNFILNHPIENSISTLRDIITEESVVAISDQYIAKDQHLEAMNFTFNIPTTTYIPNVQFHIILSSKLVTNTQNIKEIIELNDTLLPKFKPYKQALIHLATARLYERIEDVEAADTERYNAEVILDKVELNTVKQNELINYLLELKEFDIALYQLDKLTIKKDRIKFLFELSTTPLNLDEDQLALLKRIAQGN
ncbi:hypothetical protein DID80_01900 [Candidatus Marinamargulisbacteria bacterium SCGC AAA071-K20]|nr:hypothetical protein DID80_01900 [Candidatus Marinamargulisbacteria bacterium SCGC AAA071-K20]